MSRIDKVNQQIKRIVSRIIKSELDDPRVSLISITRVDTSSDLRFCKIFFSAFPEDNGPRIEEALNQMRGFIRRLLGEEMRIKFLPALEFILDDSIKYSVDIYKKLETLKNELKENS